MLQNANIYLNCDNEDNVSNVFIASRGEEEKHRKADQLQNHQKNKHLLWCSLITCLLTYALKSVQWEVPNYIDINDLSEKFTEVKEKCEIRLEFYPFKMSVECFKMLKCMHYLHQYSVLIQKWEMLCKIAYTKYWQMQFWSKFKYLTNRYLYCISKAEIELHCSVRYLYVFCE